MIKLDLPLARFLPFLPSPLFPDDDAVARRISSMERLHDVADRVVAAEGGEDNDDDDDDDANGDQ